MDVFGPWISSIPLSSDGTQIQGPSLEPETGSMGIGMEYFVESIQIAHTCLKGIFSFLFFLLFHLFFSFVLYCTFNLFLLFVFF